jgi:hypothetical protein
MLGLGFFSLFSSFFTWLNIIKSVIFVISSNLLDPLDFVFHVPQFCLSVFDHFIPPVLFEALFSIEDFGMSLALAP